MSYSDYLLLLGVIDFIRNFTTEKCRDGYVKTLQTLPFSIRWPLEQYAYPTSYCFHILLVYLDMSGLEFGSTPFFRSKEATFEAKVEVSGQIQVSGTGACLSVGWVDEDEADKGSTDKINLAEESGATMGFDRLLSRSVSSPVLHLRFAIPSHTHRRLPELSCWRLSD